MKSNKKRVLQVISYMFPAISGNGQTAYDVTTCLSRDEYEQMIICFNTGSFVDVHDARNTKTKYDKVDDIDTVRCGVWKNISSQLISFSYPIELKKAINSFLPDVVILHCPNPYLAQFVLTESKKHNFKLVLYWHSDIVKQKLLGKLFYSQNMQLLKRANNVVVTSPNYIDGSEFLSKFREKCVVIPSCIREDQYAVSQEMIDFAEQIRNENDNKIICFALGRHVPYKGFDYLIRASKLLDNRFSIYIGSEGPMTSDLKELAKDDPKVHFTGRLSDTQLKGYYLATDIFCFSSITKNEAYGLALADALYFGKPAVTFTIPGSGVNFVSLNGVTGIECPNRDVGAYAKAIEQLADNPDLRGKFGKNGEIRAKELFTYDAFKKNINILVKNILADEEDL